MKTKTLSDPTPACRRAVLSFATAALLMGGVPVIAQVPPVEPEPVAPEVAELDAGDATQAAERISASFEKLAGSEDNARKLVAAMRDGSEVTLATEVDGQAVGRTFQPATGKQGYGNVYLALVLAEQELATAGITEPTSAQLEAALNGGVITVGTGDEAKSLSLPGVLALRADGQGWGQIARRLDLKLGDVVSSLHRDPRATERLALRPEAAEKAARPETVSRPEKIERVQRVERVERPVRVERVERPVRPERPERPGRP